MNIKIFYIFTTTKYTQFEYIWVIISLLSIVACERSHSVPFDLPVYQEQLIIHAVASPQSGGQIRIKYSQPLDGNQGSPPPLPDFDAYIMQDGVRLFTFQHDSTSMVHQNDWKEVETIFMSIPPDSLDLHPGQPYSMGIYNPKTQDRYESSEVILPPKPIVNEIDINCNGYECQVMTMLGATQDPVYSISIKGQLADSLIVEGDDRSRNNQIFNRELIYPESNFWQQYTTRSTINSGVYLYPNDTISQPVNMRVSIAYLSQDLTRLIREIDNIKVFGEDIFQEIRPYHSNFQSLDREVFGIFGLYNEDVHEIVL